LEDTGASPEDFVMQSSVYGPRAADGGSNAQQRELVLRFGLADGQALTRQIGDRLNISRTGGRSSEALTKRASAADMDEYPS